MAFFGLIGNDRAMARSDYSGRESATAKRNRKEAERSAARRAGHRRSIPKTASAGQDWVTKDRREFGDERPFPRS